MTKLQSGAGVLPISLNEKGEIMILLGKERFISGWSNSNLWSGFEGSSRSGESAEANAARECFEELSGLLFQSEYQLRNDLVKENYFLKIILTCTNSRKHITYLKIVDFDAEFPEKFLKMRNLLISSDLSSVNHPAVRSIIRRNGEKEYLLNRDFIEKACVRWFTLTELEDSLSGATQYTLRPVFVSVALNAVKRLKLLV